MSATPKDVELALATDAPGTPPTPPFSGLASSPVAPLFLSRADAATDEQKADAVDGNTTPYREGDAPPLEPSASLVSVAAKYEGLLMSQKQLLVLEFTREGKKANFRHMRRADILNEASDLLRRLQAMGLEVGSQSGGGGFTAHGVTAATGGGGTRIDRTYSGRHGSGSGSGGGGGGGGGTVMFASRLPEHVDGGGTSDDEESVGTPLARPSDDPYHRRPSRTRSARGSTLRPMGTSGLLHPRDLRIIDPSFPGSKNPVFLVRRVCIILNIKPVRAIILPAKVLFFPEDGADEDLELVMERLRVPQYGQSLFMPFEFRALEAFLVTIHSKITKETDLVEPRVRKLVANLPKRSGTSAAAIHSLKLARATISRLRSHAKAIRKMLSDVLDSPAYLDMMRWSLQNLSTVLIPPEGEEGEGGGRKQNQPPDEPHQPQPPTTAAAAPPPVDATADKPGRSQPVHAATTPSMEQPPAAASPSTASSGADPVPLPFALPNTQYQTDAIELLLESSLMDIESARRRLSALRASLDDAEQQMSLFLSTSRNALLRVDLFISVVTMCIGGGALVAGYYGMNVEGAKFDYVVLYTTIAVALLTTSVFVALMRFLA